TLPATGQQVPRKAPAGPDRPLAAKLRSPRETLQTLYYAIDTYDYFPNMIHEAVACLDLHNTMPGDSASADLLAVQLECVLKSLDVPLGSVPDEAGGVPFTVNVPGEDKPILLTIARGPDGLWR